MTLGRDLETRTATPDRSARPSVWSPRPGIPLDWDRNTMAHLCSVYPFHADTGFGERGVLLGVNVTGGMSGFFFDPFEFYAQRHLTNPNMIVMGSVGFGKSATVKALLRRLKAVYGADRYLAVIDPKGEYGPLAADLGLSVIKPHPGGADRINPMDPGGGDLDGSIITRQALATQLIAGVLGRDLSPIEDAVLGWAVERRSRRPVGFTLRDLCQEVSDPPDELVQLSRHSPLELARATAPVAFALDKLCSRTLRGMFDGPTTIEVDWDHGAGSRASTCQPCTGTREALALVMAATTHWLSGALRGHQQRRSVQVIDEAWAAIRHGANYFQSSLKLSRAHGVATVLVCHRPSDLTAQSDDGTTSAKIAAGLLSDIQTRVLLRQPPEQIAAAAELFDLTERERMWLGQLVPGRAIWRIGVAFGRRANDPCRRRTGPVRHRPGDGGPCRRLTTGHVGRSTTCWTAPTWLRSSTNSPSRPAAAVPAGSGIARCRTTKTTEHRCRCSVTEPGTNDGAAGLATTAATPSTSSSPSPARTEPMPSTGWRAEPACHRTVHYHRDRRGRSRQRRHWTWTQSSVNTSTRAIGSFTLRLAHPCATGSTSAVSMTSRSRPT